jgi:hypothetical protein
VNIGYTDEHEVFDPVPVLGSHACAWLTGATVDVQLGPDPDDESWVFDSTIASVEWEIPDAIAIDDVNAVRPIATFNTTGNHVAYCTVTAATGRTAMGARYAFVFDDENPPATVFQLANCEGSVDAGGWMFDVTMQAEASLTDIRERTLVVLFARDYYNGTEQSLGPLADRENVLVVGRVGGESIRWDPIAGQVHFTVYGPQYWLNKIKVSACQLEFTSGSPTSWGFLKNLSVDRALWHLLHWRSTCTIVMDVYRTLDTRLDTKIASLANYLWGQLNEFAGLKIMAHVLCDRYGRLYAQIDPQMVPEASRSSIPTVMTVTRDDWMDVIEFERATVHETGQINISTRVVNAAGTSSTVYSLSPGHIPRKHGEWEIIDGMLSASQAGSNQMAGLLLGWKNNEFPNIPVPFWANNRFVDITPNQFLDITIQAADTPRGLPYDGNLIPRRVAFRYDAEARWLRSDVGAEGETFEQVSSNGDVPGDSDVDLSIPPLPPLPPLPDLPPIIPGGFPPSAYAGGPPKVLLHLLNAGLAYTDNFDAPSPTYIAVNAGLTALQATRINNIHICPNGAIYVAYIPSATPNDAFIARAPSIGSTFTMLYDCSDPAVNGGDASFQVWAAAINPLVSEQYGFVMGSPSGTINFYLGAGGTYATGVALSAPSVGCDSLSYGLGFWLLTKYDGYTKIAPGGGSATPSASNIVPGHIRASTTGITYHQKNGADVFIKGENNMGTATEVNSGNTVVVFEGTGIPTQADCDPSGQFIFTRVFAGAKGRSADFGSTFATIPNLPAGNYWFRWAGHTGSGSGNSRWIAAGGTVVRLTLDYGESWLNREGNITSIAAIPNINMIRVVEY